MPVTKSLNLQKSFLFPYVILKSRGWFLQDSKVLKSVRKHAKVIFSLYHSGMDLHTLKPPENYGMKVLDKNAFNKTVTVLSLETEVRNITHLQTQLKKYLLKMINLKSIQDTDDKNIKRVLFNPGLVRKRDDFDSETQELFDRLGLSAEKFGNVNVSLTYDNWPHTDVLKCILPDESPLTSFSIIGHIAHVNLKSNLLEYKSIIGQVLIDKISVIKTVVNKTNRIDNVYRNFEMELICGEPNYIANVKENGASFKFDFSKVYWNPRLSTEHERVTSLLTNDDTLFDVFCGVGPFSIPAAKKKCNVFANDLNPESIKWLKENIKLNKVSSEYIQVFNKDASDFIKNEVKSNLIQLWNREYMNYKIFVVMNLPALGPEFLKCFKGLLKSDICSLDEKTVREHLPVVHCYFFTPSTEISEIKESVSQRSDIDLNNVDHSIHFVRNVSLSKDMYKIQLVLPLEYLISDKDQETVITRDSSLDEPQAKKFCGSD